MPLGQLSGGGRRRGSSLPRRLLRARSGAALSSAPRLAADAHCARTTIRGVACAVLCAALRALLRAPHAALLYIILHCWIGPRWSSRRLRGALRGGLRASIAHGRRIAGCVRAAGALLSLVLLLLLLLVVLVLMLLLVRRGSATRLTARVAGV